MDFTDTCEQGLSQLWKIKSSHNANLLGQDLWKAGYMIVKHTLSLQCDNSVILVLLLYYYWMIYPIV